MKVHEQKGNFNDATYNTSFKVASKFGFIRKVGQFCGPKESLISHNRASRSIRKLARHGS